MFGLFPRKRRRRVIRLAAGGDAWRGGPTGTPVHRSGAMCAWRLLPTGGLQRRAYTLDPVAGVARYMGYYLGESFFDNCVNMNGAPHMRTLSRRSGARSRRSCHAPGGRWLRDRSAGGRAAVCAAHRRAESRFWGVFIIAVHRAFVLGLGARHRGIVGSCQRGWFPG